VSAAPALRDPAAAVAAGRCLNARVYDPDRWLTTDHPSRCGWCVYPQPVLAEMIADFHRWAGWDERRRVFAHHELRVWAELKREQQRDQVAAAQELESEPPPAPLAPVPGLTTVPSPATDVAAAPPEAAEPEEAPVLAGAAGARPPWFGGPS
jgi:hypothetical protein